MFVLYSTDNCIQYRPWLAYLTFPAIVIAAFALTVEGPIPQPRSMLFINFVDISGLVILAYMIAAFFVLWTFGRAVCSKIGNIMYTITLALSLLLGGGIIEVYGEDTLWLLCWVIHAIGGMYLVFYPINTVDCFIIIPPFRTFSINGLSAVIIWILADIIFCFCLDWIVPLLLNSLSLVLGAIWATATLKIKFISEGTGDKTLWQWIKGEDVDEDLVWKDSWSRNRKIKEDLKRKQEKTDELLKEKEEETINNENLRDSQKTTSVLCQCGQIIHAPARLEGKSIKCTACNQIIHVPKLDDFE